MGHCRGPRRQSLTPATAASPLYIGQFGGDTDRLSGTIDEVRIYSKALSAAEITSDMNTAIGPPEDATAPSVPASLTATAVSSTQINLSWNASNDNVGIAGYRVSRNGNVLTTTTATSYQNTGLTAGTTYTYTVAAYDAAGNFSAESAPAAATTSGGQAAGGTRAKLQIPGGDWNNNC